jgi:hypothetical protein
MPFTKGHKYGALGGKANGEGKKKLEKLLLFLQCGGADRMNEIMKQEDDDKFREDFWKGIEYVSPKQSRQEIRVKVKELKLG